MSLGPQGDGRLWLDDGYGATYAQDMAMCKRVSEALEHHYPGHPWSIGCDHEQGIVVIRLMYPSLDNKPWGYVIPIAGLKGDPAMTRVMQAGGEWLERWGLERRGSRDSDFGDALRGGLDRS